MPDLKLNTTELRETGAALRLLSVELSEAENIVEAYADDVGHPRLAHTLDEMQGSWDDRRNDLRDGIDGLGEVVEEAGKAFEEIERHLVAALEGE
ncbi:hypothetical protein [Blastococcus sp. LR1]|uniref:hypothetical protein n=1 Tax=Blastococcus sp. LR1 TaxID=2877000 RepID=UPI001CCE503E|nr:hypothetical protein [Blastococcus sp. LR1]MCA0144607.1 hypothetical protein [Blastococcus sp. LR1]